MKRVIFLICVFLLVISCGQKPEKIVNVFLKDIKLSKIEEAKKTLSNPELLDIVNFKDQNESKKIFLEALFANIKYSVQNTTNREDGTLVVNVKINNIDVEKVFDLAYKEMFRKTFNGEKDVKVKDVLLDILKNPNIPIKTNISQFLIVKENKENKILLRRENIDELFGSYFSTLNKVNGE